MSTYTPASLRARFSLSAKITSAAALDAFIFDTLANGNPAAADLLHHALGNRKKLIPRHQDDATLLDTKADKIHLVAQWITASLADNAAWLHNTRANGIPVKLDNGLDKAYADAKRYIFGSKTLPNFTKRKKERIDKLAENDLVEGILLFGLSDRRLLLTTYEISNGEIVFKITDKDVSTCWIHKPDKRIFCFRGWSNPSSAPETKGRTKKMFANRLALAKMLDVNRLESLFGFIGAYAFARMGFLPDMRSKDLPYVLDTARTRAYELYDNGKIDKKRLAQIITICGQRKAPKALWRLADLRDDIDAAPLGFHLLHNNIWKGIFNLDNPDQMARARTYIGPDHFDAVMQYADRMMQSTQIPTPWPDTPRQRLALS